MGILGNHEVIPERSATHFPTELAPHVSHAVVTSTVKGLLSEEKQETTDLVNYQVTVTETVAQVTRLLATDDGTEDIEITVALDRNSTPSIKQSTFKLQRINKKKAEVFVDRVARTEAKKKKKFSWKYQYCKWCKLSCNLDKPSTITTTLRNISVP